MIKYFLCLKDLDAYKEHARKLLTKEQELNAKLRRFNPKQKDNKD